MPSDARPPETHELKVGEEDLVYCFDFRNEPAVAAGATMSAPLATSENSSRVAVSSAQVNTEDFVEYDRDGNVVATVPAGYGVKVNVTAVAKGQCRVTCQVTCSDGQRPIIDVNFVVK